MRECILLSEVHFIRIETRFRLYGYFGIMSDISTPVNGKHVGQTCDSGECLWLNLVACILSNLISYLIPRRLSRPLKKRSGRGLHGNCRDAEGLYNALPYFCKVCRDTKNVVACDAHM
jgi:hypothetical protein